MSKRPSSGKSQNLPEWNSTIKDPDQYRLSQAELLQKKVSLISKNSLQAKEEWQLRQMKLQNNIKDEEVDQIYKTAKESKNLIQKPNNKVKKVMESSLKKKNIVKDIQMNCQETRKFIEKVEKVQNSNDQSKVPSKILSIVKQMEHQCINTFQNQEKNNPEMDDLLSSLNRIEETIKYMELGLKNPKIQEIQQQSQVITEPKQTQPDQGYIFEKESPIKQIDLSQLQEFSHNNLQNPQIQQFNQFNIKEDNFLNKSPQKQYDFPQKVPNQFMQDQQIFSQPEQLNFKDLETSSESSSESKERSESKESSISFDLTDSYHTMPKKESQLLESIQENPQNLFQNIGIKNELHKIQEKNNFFKIKEQDMVKTQKPEVVDFSQPDNVMHINDFSRSIAHQSSLYQSTVQRQPFAEIKAQPFAQIHDQHSYQEDEEEDKMLKSIQEMMESTRKDIEKMETQEQQPFSFGKQNSFQLNMNQNNFQHDFTQQPIDNEFLSSQKQSQHDFSYDEPEPMPRQLKLENFQCKKFTNNHPF